MLDETPLRRTSRRARELDLMGVQVLVLLVLLLAGTVRADAMEGVVRAHAGRSVPYAHAPLLRWEGVDATVDAYEPYSAFGVIVGNGSGILHTYAKGGYDLRAATRVASAAKWLAASVIHRVIELTADTPRPLTYASRPVDWLPEWGGLRDDDPRRAITLRTLLSFTYANGMSRGDWDDVYFFGASDPTWADCQRATVDYFSSDVPSPTADAEPPTEPAQTVFHYTGAHLQVAGYMATVAAGYVGDNAWNDLYRDVVVAGCAFTTETHFSVASARNPVVAGGLVVAPTDYASWLHAYFTGDLFADPIAARQEIEVDHTPVSTTTVAYSPIQSWHYGLGHWLECRADSSSTATATGSGSVCTSRACRSDSLPEWAATCGNACEQSSMGAFGFYPYIDRCFGKREGLTDGYWAVVSVDNGSPAASHELGTVLWPAVREAFNCIPV